MAEQKMSLQRGRVLSVGHRRYVYLGSKERYRVFLLPSVLGLDDGVVYKLHSNTKLDSSGYRISDGTDEEKNQMDNINIDFEIGGKPISFVFDPWPK